LDNDYFLSDAYDESDTGILDSMKILTKKRVKKNKNESIEPISDASVTSDS
jgi:hypothetical protein